VSRERVHVWPQKRKDRPYYTLEWHHPETGRRVSEKTQPLTASPEEAKRQAIVREDGINTGKYGFQNSKYTWAEFRKVFEREYLCHLRLGTQERAKTVFDVFEQVSKPKRVQGINERTLSDFAWRLRARLTPSGKRGLEPITIKNYLICLKTAMRWALDQRLIRELPKFPKIKVPKVRPKPINADDYQRLAQAAPDVRWRTFFLCGWWAGLRLSEVRLMTWAPSLTNPWLDLDGNRVVLPAKFVKADEDQSQPLHPELRAALEQLPRDDGRVFPFKSVGGDYKTRHAVCNKIAAIAKKAGVRLSMHRLRKGFGCRVAKQLGTPATLFPLSERAPAGAREGCQTVLSNNGHGQVTGGNGFRRSGTT
jgi:integrase